VGRDLLFQVLETVVAEDAPAAFALAAQAVEAGHDLKLVMRELSRVVRDMMLLSIDPSRADEVEFAEGDRTRLTALAARFSREDLMRAFDLLTKTEEEIKYSSQPRYHFEMGLLRWMHLRKLVPLTELIEQLGGQGARVVASPAKAQSAAPRTVAPTVAPSDPGTPGRTVAPSHPGTVAPLKDAFLAEVRAGKGFFYNTVVAQAQRIDVTAETITFAFLPAHKALREQFDQTRPWLEAAAQRITGRKMVVTAVQAAGSAAPAGEPAAPAPAEKPSAPATRDLKAEAMSSSAVQAVLDVFPAEIRDIEEM
jgi:DNA polymerase III gamma/tau subunit